LTASATISTFLTDDMLVKAINLGLAVVALQEAGHHVILHKEHPTE
jgi:hypothetical protein